MEEPQEEDPSTIHPEYLDVSRDSHTVSSGDMMYHIRIGSDTNHEALFDATYDSHNTIQDTSSHGTEHETNSSLHNVSLFVSKRSDRYRCGGCTKDFTTVGNLHDHLIQHTSDGSYFFDGTLKVAFPRYGTSCKATQTVSHQSTCSEALETFELNSQLTNTSAISAVSSMYTEKEQKNEGIQETGKRSNAADACNAGASEHDTARVDFKGIANKEKEVQHLVKTAISEVVCGIGKINEQQTGDGHINSGSNIPNAVCTAKAGCKRKFRNDKCLKKSERTITDTDTERETEESSVSGLHLTIDTKTAMLAYNQQQEKRKNHKRIKGAKCPYCGLIFTNPNALSRHKTASHKDQLIIPCSLCGKILSSKATLRAHMHLHNENKRFSCPICEKSFKSQSQLTDHKLIHSDTKNFICQHCGEAFYTRHSLDKHINKCLGNRPFSCPYDGCDKKFYYKHSVGPHLRQHTGERPFVCDCCGKSFTRANKLHEHLLAHTGDKPWPCPSCPKAFTRSDLLQRHKRTHSKETPFKCRFCVKSFSHGWNLKSHERQHTGEMPYTCDVCGRGFKHNVSRKAHMASQHKLSHSSI